VHCACVEGAALAVMYALSDGQYSNDAELAFIQCFLRDDRLQALLRVSHCNVSSHFTVSHFAVSHFAVSYFTVSRFLGVGLGLG